MKKTLTAVAVLGLSVGSWCSAQCAPAQLAGNPHVGTDGIIHVVGEWDPDGSGPAGTLVVVGGSFRLVVGTRAVCLATYDPQTDEWASIGDVGGTVRAITVAANGDLVIGGSFQSVDGVAVGQVARFDGTSWSSVGSGLANGFATGQVLSLQGAPNGDIFVGGTFSQAGGQPAEGVARFDGVDWQPTGIFNMSGWATGSIHDLALLPSGDLVAVGWFNQIGTQTFNAIARWDGTAWHPFGAGMETTVGGFSTGYVAEVAPNGDLFVNGVFTSIDGVPANGLARWDGAGWHPVPGVNSNSLLRLHAEPNGDLLVASLTAELIPATGSTIARWDGASMQTVGFNGPERITGIVDLPNGNLLAGGIFEAVGTQAAAGVARFGGTAWGPMSSGGSNGAATVAEVLSAGRTFVGGPFTMIGGVATDMAAIHDGVNWQAVPLPEGRGAPVAAVETSEGVLYCAAFTAPTQTYSTASTIFQRVGNGWVTIGHANGRVRALAESPDGRLVAVGGFNSIDTASVGRAAVWDGVAWSPLHAGTTGEIFDIDWLHDGRPVIAGLVSAPTFNYWVGIGGGATWQGIPGGPTQQVKAVAVTPNGDLYVGGRFGAIAAGGANIARWDGASWFAVGGGVGQHGFGVLDEVANMTALANGDVVVGGRFTSAGGVSANNVARWDGVLWHSFGSGLDAPPVSMSSNDEGQLAIGGDFVQFDGQVTYAVARLAAPCPAVVQSFGTGCAIPSAGMRLEVANAPYVGGVLRTRGLDLPVGSISLGVYGFQAQNVTLSSLLPQALPGCSLLVTADYLMPVLTVAGVAEHALSLPGNMSLLGQVLYHQVVSVEVGASGLTRVLSTDAAGLVVGALW